MGFIYQASGGHQGVCVDLKGRKFSNKKKLGNRVNQRRNALFENVYSRRKIDKSKRTPTTEVNI